MSIHEHNQDRNQIENFCASRGYGAEIKDYLLQRSVGRMKAADSLSKREAAFRFHPVSESQLQQWIVEMHEGPSLF